MPAPRGHHPLEHCPWDPDRKGSKPPPLGGRANRQRFGAEVPNTLEAKSNGHDLLFLNGKDAVDLDVYKRQAVDDAPHHGRSDGRGHVGNPLLQSQGHSFYVDGTSAARCV